MKTKKGLIVLLAFVSIVIVALTMGCTDPEKGERAELLETQSTTTIVYSNERAIFEGYLAQVNDPNNIQWIYCMDYMGHVVLQSAVMGKTISATKSSEPYERVVCWNTGTCGFEDKGAEKFAGFIPGTPQLMNPSGMFGHDTPGVIWMDPQGNYHEWHNGPYFVSNIPLKVREPILSFADVDQELVQKVREMEQKLRAGGELTVEELTYLETA